MRMFVTEKEGNENIYKGIRVDFLKALFGEEWQEIFNNAWGSKKEFMKDYKIEYKEWLEFEE